MIKKIHHVSLIVADLERSLEFYNTTLGIPLDVTRPEMDYPGVWLLVGAQQIHLLQLPNPDPISGRPEHGGRDRHLALAVADLRLAGRSVSHLYNLRRSKPYQNGRRHPAQQVVN